MIQPRYIAAFLLFAVYCIDFGRKITLEASSFYVAYLEIFMLHTEIFVAHPNIMLYIQIFAAYRNANFETNIQPYI